MYANTDEINKLVAEYKKIKSDIETYCGKMFPPPRYFGEYEKRIKEPRDRFLREFERLA